MPKTDRLEQEIMNKVVFIMKRFLTKKMFSPLVVIILLISSIGGTIGADRFWGSATAIQNSSPDIQKSPEYLYAQAVKDAVTIEPEEILPVLKLTKDNDLVTFNNKNEVLLVTWHKYPDSYLTGQQVTLKYGAVWTFTDKEIAQWYKNNKDGVEDWDLRLKQLIGLPASSNYTHFTAMWVPLDKIKRPAYTSDIKNDVATVKFAENADKEFTQWFDSNIIDSYFEGAYPWTRLGYTYDWADNGKEYGLSEFLVAKGTTATVEFTYSTQDFLKWLEEQQ